jgi:Integrase
MDTTNFIRHRIQPSTLANEFIALVIAKNARPQSRRSTGGPVAYSSQLQHVQKITALICIIQRSEYPLLNLRSLSRDHIDVALAYIRDRNPAAGSIDNWVCSLNRLLSWLNKKNLHVSSRDLRKHLGIPSRKGYAVVNKATSDLLVIDNAIRVLSATQPQFAAVLQICRVLPLRVREAMCLDVGNAVKKIIESDSFELVKGTKNGRPRRIVIWNYNQLLALQSVAHLCNKTYGSLINEDCNLKDSLKLFHRSVRRLGMTSAKRTNPHSLRHLLLQDFFTQSAGFAPPIMGVNLAIKQNNLIAKDRYQRVAELAGHSRVGKASAYLGSIRAYQPEKT